MGKLFKFKKRPRPDENEMKEARIKAIKEARERKKQELEAKKQKDKAIKEAKKKRLADLKKDKEELYILRKNTAFKVLRFILWAMIAFIFVKGVIVSIRPDPTLKVNAIIKEFQDDLNKYQNQNNEIMAFAQNFVMEYMTYESGKEQDYVNRLKTYASDTLTTASYRFPAGSTAVALYAGAYRQSNYNSNQYDVWVRTTVDYSMKEVNSEGISTEIKDKDTVVLKVPVSVVGNRYIVEDYPIYVADDQKSGYEKKTYAGKECTEDIKNAVELALVNFYKAYYEADQSVIDYYLSPEADRSKFIGLQGRVGFGNIKELRVYYRNENSTTDFIALVTLEIKEKNNAAIIQHYNLHIVYKDKQYYVVDMDARNTNINLNQ